MRWRGATAGVAALLVAAFGALAPAGESSSTRRPEALRLPQQVAKQRRVSSQLVARARREHRLVVEIEARRPEAVQSLVRRLGGRTTRSWGRLVEASLPSSAIPALARSADVRTAREPLRPVPESVRGEGVAATGAARWHASGLRGAGVRVAVVDVGFDGWRDSVRNGDLPRNTVAVDLCPGRFDGPAAVNHGTAVAEIVAEMAPAARLYLICVDTVAALGRAKDYVVAQRIPIVNHAASWFNSSRGDDTAPPESPTGIVTAARAAGVLWVNAAGNRAQQHWAGTFADADADGVHEFAPGDEGNGIFVAAGQRACIALKWDAWPATAIDYDLYLTRASDGAVVAASTDPQTGVERPAELLCYLNATGSTQLYAIAIEGPPTPTPRLDLFTFPGPNLEHQVADGSITEPGSSSAALTVGAVCWRNNALEAFSGRGPTIDGRLKPDLVGPDWVSSFAYGRFRGCGAESGFAGTSAATPHVAGAAALVKGASPALSADELRAYLDANAVDLGPPGRDTAYGAGKLALGPSPRPPLRTCVVPRVTRLRLAQARTRIVRAGCTVGRVRRARSRVRRGRVVAQTPRAGRRVRFRARVNLTVSRGTR